MNGEVLGDIVEVQIKRSTDLLAKKNGNYNAGEDKLRLFGIAADLQSETRAQALAGFMSKHTISLYDMIHSGASYTEEEWNEKITDHINYLLLLRAIVEEDHISDQKSPGEDSPEWVDNSVALLPVEP